jgi:hypothetical protein
MTTWTANELNAMGNAEELTLASLRRDGTLRRPVTMWVVRAGDDIYVRSVNGRGSSWFRGARDRHEARIRAGGIEKNVVLIEIDDARDAVDAASGEVRQPLRVGRALDRRARGAGGDAEAGAKGGLMPDGTFITGSDFLMDGGVTASYFYGELAPH